MSQLVTELKDLGNKAFGSSRYQEAVELYTKAIEVEPNAVLYSNRAISYLKLQEWNKALQDCDTGLAIVDDEKVKTKLLFRKASCFGGMRSKKLARTYYEKVVEMDPHNQAATQELKLLNDDMEDIEEHGAQRINIPVEQVDVLPEEFQRLVENKPLNATTESPALQPPVHGSDQSSDLVNKEIDELFGKKTKKPTKEHNNKDEFVKRSATSILPALKAIPGANKENAYNFLINIPAAELADDFSFGLEHEFLSFYFESAAYVSSNNTVDGWDQKILQTLKALSQLKRYSISKMLCDETQINTIIENVSKTNSELVPEYRSLLIET